jgi:hypothetical protein
MVACEPRRGRVGRQVIMDTWIEIGGLTIHSPVATFTNLLLCA